MVDLGDGLIKCPNSNYAKCLGKTPDVGERALKVVDCNGNTVILGKSCEINVGDIADKYTLCNGKEYIFKGCCDEIVPPATCEGYIDYSGRQQYSSGFECCNLEAYECNCIDEEGGNCWFECYNIGGRMFINDYCILDTPLEPDALKFLFEMAVEPVANPCGNGQNVYGALGFIFTNTPLPPIWQWNAHTFPESGWEWIRLQEGKQGIYEYLPSFSGTYNYLLISQTYYEPYSNAYNYEGACWCNGYKKIWYTNRD